jgi:isopentenyldiphosphate isomerase
LDIVDEHNRIISSGSRSYIHQNGDWHRGVHIFLFNQVGELLVQERSPLQDTYAGALDCSVSEHLRKGEGYYVGAIRGLKEELGLEPVTMTRLLHFKLDYGPSDNMINELYQGVLNSQQLIVDRSEIGSIRFENLASLEVLLESGKVAFSRWFKQLLYWYLGKRSEIDILWENLEGSRK